MRPVKTHTFNRVRFDIDLYGKAIDGKCDYPYQCKPVIMICEDVNNYKGLESIIHECLHAEQWAKGEDVVDRTAREIAKFLWRLNFRRQ